MTLHHEAVVLGDNRNAPGRLRQDQRYHQDQKGWVDIAYHVGIDRDGIFALGWGLGAAAGAGSRA